MFTIIYDLENSMLDYRIRSFITVWEEKSFTLAAQKLCLTQSAVSQHIKSLEEQFGKKLFHFQGRELTLTAAGERLYGYAAVAQADGNKTMELILREEKSPPLRIGATRTIGAYLLPTLLGTYLRRYPDADFSVAVENTQALLEKLQRGLLDFVLIEGIFDRQEYSNQTILQDAFIPLCSPQNPLAQKTVSIQALLQERLFVRETGSGSRAILENALATFNLGVNDFHKRIELGNIEAIKDLVAQNLGIAFLYKQSVLRELKQKRLAQIRVTDLSIYHDYSFVTLKNSQYKELYQNFYQISQNPLDKVSTL